MHKYGKVQESLPRFLPLFTFGSVGPADDNMEGGKFRGVSCRCSLDWRKATLLNLPGFSDRLYYILTPEHKVREEISTWHLRTMLAHVYRRRTALLHQ